MFGTLQRGDRRRDPSVGSVPHSGVVSPPTAVTVACLYSASILFPVAVRDVPTCHPVATMVNAAAGASKEDDIQKMLKCATHLGTKNCDVLMEPYVFKRRVDGTFCQAECLVHVVWGLEGRASPCGRLSPTLGRRSWWRCLMLVGCPADPTNGSRGPTASLHRTRGATGRSRVWCSAGSTRSGPSAIGGTTFALDCAACPLATG